MCADRVSYLNGINSFLTTSKSILSNILSTLNWNEENLVTYGKYDSFADNINANNTNSNNEQVQTINCKDNAVKNSGFGLNEIIDSLPVATKKEKEKSLLEILAQERDLKRRRVSYKGRIHTKHKSHTEILREVITQQMEAFEFEEPADNISKFNQESIDVMKISNNFKFVYDLSKLYSSNPHLAWKNVRKEVESIEKKKEMKSNSKIEYDEDFEEANYSKFSNKPRKCDKKRRFSDDNTEEYVKCNQKKLKRNIIQNDREFHKYNKKEKYEDNDDRKQINSHDKRVERVNETVNCDKFSKHESKHSTYCEENDFTDDKYKSKYKQEVRDTKLDCHRIDTNLEKCKKTHFPIFEKWESVNRHKERNNSKEAYSKQSKKKSKKTHHRSDNESGSERKGKKKKKKSHIRESKKRKKSRSHSRSN